MPTTEQRFEPSPPTRSSLLAVRCPCRVRRALELLLASEGELVSLERLAECTSYDKFHLSRLFVRYFNAPPARLHRQFRLSRAATLLRAGHTVGATAAELGFADQSHFTRLFKRLYGVPPGAYARARLKPGADPGGAYPSD
jgi:AraC-like DNA-binding protein